MESAHTSSRRGAGVKNRYFLLGITGVLALSLTVPALGGPSNPIASSAAKGKNLAARALRAANAAQATADKAQTTANTAQTTATKAVTDAAAAKTAADAANANANTRLKATSTVVGAGSGTSSSNKLDIAVCATGQDLTGGGFQTGGAGANDVTPVLNVPYGSGWLALMQEIGAGTAETWDVVAYAQCASR